MLKAGMKIFSDKLNTSQMDLNLSSPQPSSFNKFKTTGNLKQMLLTDKLQLKASDKIMDVSLARLLKFNSFFAGSSFTEIHWNFHFFFRLQKQNFVDVAE
jgi:hypothetical protein